MATRRTSIMMERIPKSVLAKRLGRTISYPVDAQGLAVLLYGWRKYRKYGPKYCHAMETRDWLYITEVMDFSLYAGYDLTQNSSC